MRPSGQGRSNIRWLQELVSRDELQPHELNTLDGTWTPQRPSSRYGISATALLGVRQPRSREPRPDEGDVGHRELPHSGSRRTRCRDGFTRPRARWRSTMFARHSRTILLSGALSVALFSPTLSAGEEAK